MQDGTSQDTGKTGESSPKRKTPPDERAFGISVRGWIVSALTIAGITYPFFNIEPGPEFYAAWALAIGFFFGQKPQSPKQA